MPIRLPLRRPTSNLPRNTILIQIRFVTVCSSNMWLIWQLLTLPHATLVLTRSSSSVEHVKACLHNTSEAPTALSSSSFCDAQGMFELCLAEDFLAMSIVLINYTTCTSITLGCGMVSSMFSGSASNSKDTWHHLLREYGMPESNDDALATK